MHKYLGEKRDDGRKADERSNTDMTGEKQQMTDGRRTNGKDEKSEFETLKQQRRGRWRCRISQSGRNNQVFVCTVCICVFYNSVSPCVCECMYVRVFVSVCMHACAHVFITKFLELCRVAVTSLLKHPHCNLPAEVL